MNDEYEVEKIIDHKQNKIGLMYYLIKWKGYASSENTWQPADNFQSSTYLLEQYHSHLKNQQKMRKKKEQQKKKQKDVSRIKNQRNRRDIEQQQEERRIQINIHRPIKLEQIKRNTYHRKSTNKKDINKQNYASQQEKNVVKYEKKLIKSIKQTALIEQKDQAINTYCTSKDYLSMRIVLFS